MILSGIFEKYGRTEIGPQFPISFSSPDLNIGVARAIVKSFAKILKVFSKPSGLKYL